MRKSNLELERSRVIGKDNLGGAQRMTRQSVGVTPFKGLIRWLYPRAVAAFDGCAKLHDEAYKTVDWSVGADATLNIDQKFCWCCVLAANGDAELLKDAAFFYRVCRRWGKMRAALWQIGVRY